MINLRNLPDYENKPDWPGPYHHTTGDGFCRHEPFGAGYRNEGFGCGYGYVYRSKVPGAGRGYGYDRYPTNLIGE